MVEHFTTELCTWIMDHICGSPSALPPPLSGWAHNWSRPCHPSLSVGCACGCGWRWPLHSADLPQYGGVWGFVYTSGHHGQWTVQVSGQYSTPQEQVSFPHTTHSHTHTMHTHFTNVDYTCTHTFSPICLHCSIVQCLFRVTGVDVCEVYLKVTLHCYWCRRLWNVLQGHITM